MDISNLSASDFASMRLVVMTANPDVVIDPEHVLANYDSIYLLQYSSVEQSMRAYRYYTDTAIAAEPDMVLETASDDTIVIETAPDAAANDAADDGITIDEPVAFTDPAADEPAADTEVTDKETESVPVDFGDDLAMTVNEEQNPIAGLSEEEDSAAALQSDKVIALIDTGASESANVIDRVSLIDDALEGSNLHANEMVAAIVSQNPDAKILSIRAMGDDGKGTVSSIVAAMEYAMNQHVDIINLSLYAKTNLLNSVLQSEIQKAADMGIVVVGAAGNDGADVADYMPGSVACAYIIGACDETGKRIERSNYGATVDYNVAADSTSEAAAKFTGYVSLYGVDSIPVNDGLIYATDYVAEEPIRTYDANTLTVALGSEFDPETDYDDLSKLIPDGADVTLQESDVDVHTVGLYHTVYHVTTDESEFLIRRPVEVVDETADGYRVTFLTNMDDQVVLQTLKTNYAAGETVEFSVTPKQDSIVDYVLAYQEDDPNATEFDDSEALALEHVSDEHEAELALFDDANASEYYRFMMPEGNVTILVNGQNGSFMVADGSDDELTKFTLHQSNSVYTYHSGAIDGGRVRGTRYRTVKYSWKDDDGTTKNEEVMAYCMQPIMESPPIGPNGDTVYNSSNQSVVAIPDSGLVSKAMFYLYGGPMWNKTVTDKNGKDVNMKTVLDQHKPTAPGHTDKRGYYALTHFILGYLYCNGPSNDNIWNYEDDGPNKPYPVWNGTGKQWLASIKTTLSNLPAPTTDLRHGTTKVSIAGTTVPASELTKLANGTYRTPSYQYYTYSENTMKVVLPTGVSMHYEYTDDAGQKHSVDKSGTVSGIPGGAWFYLIIDPSKMTLPADRTFELSFISKFPINYEAWKLVTNGAQDIGFSYRTGNKTEAVAFALPDEPQFSHIQVRKTNSANSWSNALSGVQFGLYEGNTRLETITINDANYHAFAYDCQVDHTYTIRETRTPAGYMTAADVTVRIASGDAYRELYSQTIVNGDGPKVQVTKTSTAAQEILNLKGYSLEGAEFGIYTDQACTHGLTTLRTVASGQTGVFTLPCQAEGTYTYWVREDKAPAGHIRNTTPKSFTVTLPADAGKTIPVEMTNDPEFTQHSLDVIKRDSKGWVVPNAVFRVQYFDADTADSGRLVKTWYLRSDRQGHVYMDEWHVVEGRPEYRSDPFFTWNGNIVIPIGGYLQLTEVEAPAEYIVDSTPMGFATTRTVKLTHRWRNTLEPCRINLKKFDTNGRTPLAGVTFELTFVKESESYTADADPSFNRLLREGQSVQRTTNASGEISFDNLDQGTYRITEVKTTDSHTLLRDPIEVTLPIKLTAGQIASQGNVDVSKGRVDPVTGLTYFYECLYEVTNEYNFNVPMTGATGNWKYGFVGVGVLAMVSAGYVVFGRKRRKRKLHDFV